MTLNAACRARREAAGLTLADVGERIGVDGSHLGRFERSVAGLSVGRINRLLDALDLVVVPRDHVCPPSDAAPSASAA